MAPPEKLDIEEPNDAGVLKHPFFCSVRMTYVICGFVGMLLHHALRSSVNVAILCMVAELPKPTIYNQILSTIDDCETSPKFNETHGHPRHSGDLQWSREEEVLFPSAFFYGFVFVLPFGGYLADKYGGKVLFVGSIMLEGAIFLLIPVCARINFWFAVVVRALQGVIAGLGNPSVYELYTAWTHPSERSASLAFGFSGFTAAQFITYPTVGLLCSYGWDMVFYIMGGLTFGVGFLMNWLVYASIGDHPRISPKEYNYLKAALKPKTKVHKTPWKSIFTSIPYYAFTFTHFFQSFGSAMCALMMPRFYKEAMHFSIQESAFLTSAVFLGSYITMIFSMGISTLVAKKGVNMDWFHRLIHLACCWTVIPLIIAIVRFDCKERWIVFALWIIINVLTEMAFCCGYWPTISFIAPSYSGLLIGIANGFGTTSSVVVPLLVAHLVPTGSSNEWDYVVGLLAITYFFNGLSFAVFGSTKLQPWGLKKEDEEAKR